VGAFPRGAGPFGTLDQAGNVWEWCVDVWDDQAYRREERAKEDPVGTRGDDRVRCLRGGSWGGRAGGLAAAYRERGSARVKGSATRISGERWKGRSPRRGGGRAEERHDLGSSHHLVFPSGGEEDRHRAIGLGPGPHTLRCDAI